MKLFLKTVLKLSTDLTGIHLINMSTILKDIQIKQSRLLILGVGGRAGNESNAVNDFRKISGWPSIVSVFEGRISNTGRDPVTLMKGAVDAQIKNFNI